MLVYRLGSRRHPANDGLGASLYGGRWNHKGTPVIYRAASRALCALEILANADELAGDYGVVSIELPDDLAVTNRSVEALPLNWNAREPGNDTRDIGTNLGEQLGDIRTSCPFRSNRSRVQLHLKSTSQI